jgi:uncharacterized membrane protein
MRPIETPVALVLVVGALLAIALMTAGLALYEVQAPAGAPTHEALEHALPHSPAGTLAVLRATARGLARRPPDPLALTTFGSLLLLLTPVAGVVTATVAFARAGDRLYAAIGVGILLAVMASFAVGAAP